MAFIAGPLSSGNVGEDLFVEKAAEFLDDAAVIYRNRQVYGREFDVCILLPDVGILIVEVKGWREDTVLRIEDNTDVVISTDDGEVHSSPQRQARGYRFSLQDYIRRSFGRRPLVFQMVCFPQISRDFYLSRKLNVVTEEQFTFLKDDLADAGSFSDKLYSALQYVSSWLRDPFDERTMLEVRSLFESDIDLSSPVPADPAAPVVMPLSRRNDYSRLSFFADPGPLPEEILGDLVSCYMSGCRLFCIFSSPQQMEALVSGIDSALRKRGLVRRGNSIEIAFEQGLEHTPVFTPGAASFSAFNLSLSVIKAPVNSIPSFTVINGRYKPDQLDTLKYLGSISEFNAEQYLVEHAPPEKHIIIRAGAGTGKTYTMISRIGFICYMQSLPLQKMAEHITMITFTNEAADQMSKKLKDYFRNCYLLTSQPEYLSMVTSIDQMQISTIHSFAKEIITRLGTSFGYGIDLSITSSEYQRKIIIGETVDEYITQKEKELGRGYLDLLGMPVYAIRDTIADFISRLHNKSVDFDSLDRSAFGQVAASCPNPALHSLFSEVIPEVEKRFSAYLLDNDQLHLGSLMSLLNTFLSKPENRERILDLKKDDVSPEYLFVDEFQDTDDTQIDSILRLVKMLNYRMFLVGDIKQCIYRFRGAEEKAFDRLPVSSSPEEWLEFSLQRNYRTDSRLLSLFDRSFSSWGADAGGLLDYDSARDRLYGTRDYNGSVEDSCFYRCIQIPRESGRMNALVEEIRYILGWISDEESRGIHLSPVEKSIAILVRENWQAEEVRRECSRLAPDLTIQTNTGGDLYMSPPALDMMTLINALVHFDEPDSLYNFVSSNFFNVSMSKSSLYSIREKNPGDDMSLTVLREQADYLTGIIDEALRRCSAGSDDPATWAGLVEQLRTQPVLQVIRRIYNILEPWKNCAPSSLWEQQSYQMNVDLLFEELINGCSVNRLTINTLQDHLYYSIVSRRERDRRRPDEDLAQYPIQCITVHKAKGLEYGHVILPFCSKAIDYRDKSKLQISISGSSPSYRIGYSLQFGEAEEEIHNEYFDEELETEETCREETRILYVAMTRSIRSFSWIKRPRSSRRSWQNLIDSGGV